MTQMSIRVEATLKTIKRGYFDPKQVMEVIAETINETYFRVWTMSAGCWMSCKVDEVQQKNAVEDDWNNTWSMTIPAGSVISVTVISDSNPNYKKEIVFTISDTEVTTQQPKGIKVSVKQEKTNIKNINSKFQPKKEGIL